MSIYIRDLGDVSWAVSDAPVDYLDAVRRMEERVEDIRAERASELVWLLEHPPLYTAGTSATPSDLLDPGRLPVFATGRGGQYTYHGPGQRIAYAMLDLKVRGVDVRAYVARLEDWLIATLARFDVRGERRAGRIGIWVDRGGGRDDKIAAIGVRVRHWVTYHGVALNVDCDLSHFAGIVPCGVRGHGVTSLSDLGVSCSMAEVDAALRETFAQTFSAAIRRPVQTGERAGDGSELAAEDASRRR